MAQRPTVSMVLRSVVCDISPVQSPAPLVSASDNLRYEGSWKPKGVHAIGNRELFFTDNVTNQCEATQHIGSIQGHSGTPLVDP